MLKKILILQTVMVLLFSANLFAQDSTKKETTKSDKKVEIAKLEKEKTEAAKKNLSDIKYRLIQDNGFFVDGAFTQEEGFVQHTFKLKKTFNGGWQSVVEEEIPLGSEKHELGITMPTSGFTSGENGRVRGFGDLEIEYRYRLVGGESSRVTIAPTFGVSLPTGSYKRELGSGSYGTETSLPVSIAFTKRFMTNSKVAVSFIPRARNAEGDRAFVTNYEVGQSFVWLNRNSTRSSKSSGNATNKFSDKN